MAPPEITPEGVVIRSVHLNLLPHARDRGVKFRKTLEHGNLLLNGDDEKLLYGRQCLPESLEAALVALRAFLILVVSVLCREERREHVTV